MIKACINLSDELVTRIDGYAKRNGINRTSAICVLCTQALDQNDTIQAMPVMSEILDKLQQIKLLESSSK